MPADILGTLSMVHPNEAVGRFIERAKAAVKADGLDLSSDEDLSIGIMNLISIEEHLFFTANKTSDDKYYARLNEVREMRKSLLKEIIHDYEGEVWCISKHLLAASMRLMEVGTKALTKGEDEKAKGLFQRSYRLYMMFWEMNLKLDGRPLAGIEPDAPLAAPRKYIADNITLFFSEDCEHCKRLEMFLNQNDLYSLFDIKKKEVSLNKENHLEMEELYRRHIDPKRELVLPVACHNNTCYMGEEVIRMFKNQMWEAVKEKEQTLRKLLQTANLPPHIKNHHENYKKILDTALNCCRE
jgi:hypothetical protein